MSDGLQGDEFIEGCYFQGPDGEMFFGGSNGFNAFLPENDQRQSLCAAGGDHELQDSTINPFPLALSRYSRKPSHTPDSLTLSYRDNVFSFEFAALSYANSRKNRYRYRLVGFDPGWNEVSSAQRLATYTNLDPGNYVFRVQGSNSDGVWNEEGVSLPILITPPWYKENWFRVLCCGRFSGNAVGGLPVRLRQLHWEFDMRLKGALKSARVSRANCTTLCCRVSRG